MIRIFGLSFLFLILVFAMAYGISGSGAWFTDQVNIENNSISTGNIYLVVSDLVSSDPALEPGGDYQEMLRFCVKNGGSYNMKWRGMLTAVKAPAGMADQILMRGVILDLEKDANVKKTHDGEKAIWFTDKTATMLMHANPHILLDASTNEIPFKPNDRFCYSIQAKLSGNADSTYQKETFAATLQLDATQWISTDGNWSK